MIKRIVSCFLSVVCLIASYMVFPYNKSDVAAYDKAKDSRVIVSMGDSYSSGEGLHDYYGEELPESKRKSNQDFLSHRSKNSWPAQLYSNSSNTKTMKDVKDDDNWFFVAMSGAITNNIIGGQKITDADPTGYDYQYKDYLNRYSLNPYGLLWYEVTDRTKIDLQIDVFDRPEIKNKEVDYVTMTIGGNDVDFAGIVQTLALSPTTICPNFIYDKITSTYDILPDVAEDLEAVYSSVSKKAGEQAHIIVAGYPRLLEPTGNGTLISAVEAKVVNEAIDDFNNRIETTVKKCATLYNMNISFVPVDFSGHEIYSDDPWLYNYEWFIKSDDISDLSIKNSAFVSSASFHPNSKGAAEYARLVNAEIERIEQEKKATRATDPQVMSDALNDIVGTYKGLYVATQGETGLTLTVYEENGAYKALFDFYNLPGKTNAQDGQYYMNVSYDIDTYTYSFDAYEWIKKPTTYSFVNLKGKLIGDILSGESPTFFSLTKITEGDAKADAPETDNKTSKVMGNWVLSEDLTKNNNNQELNVLFGDMYSENHLTFNEDGTFSWGIGVMGREGTYVVTDKGVNVTYSNSESGEESKQTFKFLGSGVALYISIEHDNGNSYWVQAQSLNENIPEDAFEYNGHKYKIYSNVCDTWEDAQAYCESLGGHLAVISSQEENDSLYGYIVASGILTAYFGYTDVETEGQWKWITDDDNLYENWHSEEPNDSGNEDYAELYWKYTDGTWNDGNFGFGTESDEKNFICEWE